MGTLGAQLGIRNVCHCDVRTVIAHRTEGIIILCECGKRKARLPVCDIAQVPSVDRLIRDAFDWNAGKSIISRQSEDLAIVSGVGPVVKSTATAAGIDAADSKYILLSIGTEVIQCVRPREIRLEGEAVAQTLFDLKLAGVVVAVHSGVD